jgi:hypothetical protein
MIDQTIEQALAPDKLDWKEPLWAKFKSYAIGFGAAALVVALLLSALYLWKGSEAALTPQTELVTMTIEPIPQVTAKAPAQQRVKVAAEKIAAQAVNTPATASFDIEKQPVKKPRIDDGFTAEFDKQVLNFESKL